MSFDYLTLSALSAVPVSTTESVVFDLHARWQSLYYSPVLTGAVAKEIDEEGTL
jgi:hypothetical protein